MPILILGGEDDEHAMHVLQFLARIGRPAFLLDSRRFPQNLRISWSPDTGSGFITIEDGRTIPLEEISAVYWRNYFGVLSPRLPDSDQSYIAQNDSRSLFESLLIQLPARWVNSWAAYQSHQTKPAQLAILAAAGIPVPPTLVTNDPDAVREFVRRHSRVISKPVQGGAHARRLALKDLSSQRLRNLAIAPIALQEEIVGESVRVFIAGEALHACEFETSALDYRDDPSARLKLIALPSDVADFCRRAAAVLGLVWTGIDLRRTVDGRYVLLEANPSPMFLGFEERTGLPLTTSLIDLLIAP
ncbi:Ribosomal protein S6--L-glutamate ligase [Caulifigura coniformis]|uniref:Ribosomal protein S6--L-glutamate ligase n=1 Tax=Caulifigura coniformis TaxID=2527983 RepID=A0A517SDB7_9PLAN|nr:RimK-like protein [Caulifigura coniformis]QDT54116.1 Ribosomal protein S6--L-glutamate ligase [Caulifigura coniformis]